jgi:hypothetical protein
MHKKEFTEHEGFFKKWIFIFNNKFKYNKHHKSINNLKNCFLMKYFILLKV